MPTKYLGAGNEVMRRVRDLIHADFPHLAPKRIVVLFVEKTDNDGAPVRMGTEGKYILGKASVVTGRNAWLASGEEALDWATEPDPFFCIELCQWGWNTLTDKQREALLHHELAHCDVNEETGKPKLLPHSIEEHSSTIAKYGLWKPDLEAFVKAGARQMSLLDQMEAACADDDALLDVVEYETEDGQKILLKRVELLMLWGKLEERVSNTRQMNFVEKKKDFHRGGVTITHGVFQAVADAVNGGALDGPGVTVTASVGAS